MSPHPTAKPSWGWLRVVVRKLHLVLFELDRTRNKVTAKAKAYWRGCATKVAERRINAHIYTWALRTLDGQMPSQKRMATAVSQGHSLACQRRASQIKINTKQGPCYCICKERKKGDGSYSPVVLCRGRRRAACVLFGVVVVRYARWGGGLRVWCLVFA